MPLALSQIEQDAPDVPLYGGGKWAIYGAQCCWWTTYPSDVGLRGELRLPCCPHCGGVLFQAPLNEFLAAARSNSEHYGPGGLLTFAAAHSRNATRCHRGWDKYELEEHA